MSLKGWHGRSRGGKDIDPGLTGSVDDPRFWTPNLGYDEEFNEFWPVGDQLPSPWEWKLQGTSTFAQKFGQASILFQTGGGSDILRCIRRPTPSSLASWEWTTKLTYCGENADYNSVGVFLFNTAGTKWVGFTLGESNTLMVVVRRNSDSSVSGYDYGPQAWRNYGPGIYLRVRYNSGTSVDFEHSADGVTYFSVKAAMNANSFLGADPDMIGIGQLATRNNSALALGIHWTRVRPVGQDFNYYLR